MNKEQSLVYAFHKKYGCITSDIPTVPSDKILLLRMRLIGEEFSELMAASSNGDIVKMADALADIMFVVYGTAVAAGIDLEPVFAEVARSNMTKDGGGIDTGGKVIKGPAYQPPNILPILEEMRKSYFRNIDVSENNLDGHNA